MIKVFLDMPIGWQIVIMVININAIALLSELLRQRLNEEKKFDKARAALNANNKTAKEVEKKLEDYKS